MTRLLAALALLIVSAPSLAVGIFHCQSDDATPNSSAWAWGDCTSAGYTDHTLLGSGDLVNSCYGSTMSHGDGWSGNCETGAAGGAYTWRLVSDVNDTDDKLIAQDGTGYNPSTFGFGGGGGGEDPPPDESETGSFPTLTVDQAREIWTAAAPLLVLSFVGVMLRRAIKQ